MSNDIERNENHDTAGKSEKGSSKKLRIVIRALILSGCVAITVLTVMRIIKEEEIKREEQRQSIINSGVFHDGIVIHGISVGGMNMEQARRAVKQAEQELSNSVRFTLTHEGAKYYATAEDFGLTFNTDDVLKEAFAVGRDGSLDELTGLLGDLSLNNMDFPIAYKADDLKVRSFVSTVAEALYIAPQDAKLTSIIDPRTLEYDEKHKNDFVLSASTTSSEERISYVKEEEGQTLNSPALYYKVTNMLERNEFCDMELPVIPLLADITLENIEERIVLRGKATTSYAKSPYNRSSRVYNIRKAVSLINGVVIEPDEIFSTNTILGNRTYDSGWKGAPAIVGGDTEDQAGGGVCQVSTTLYNCVLVSDLEVVDRRGHSSKIGYVAGGLDATIDSGHIDFQWKNTSNSRIYVFAWVDTKKKTVNFELYGEEFPEEYDEIKITSRKLSTVSPKASTKYIVDYDLDPGERIVNIARKYGSVWESYATYYKDGEKVKTVEIDRTTYKAYAGEVVIGPEVVEAATEE